MTSTAGATEGGSRPAQVPLGPAIKASLVLLGAAVLALCVLGYLRPLGGVQLFKIQADAFLAGRLDLGAPYPDTAVFGGRFYMPLGPLPAALMVPLAAAGGLFAQELWLELAALALMIPALNALFVELGIERASERALLSVATLAGTTYLSALTLDSSYYIANLVVAALLTWALLWSLQGRRPMLAGLLVGLAAMTRAPALMALVPIALLQATQPTTSRSKAIALVVAGVLPSLVVIGLFNQLRFGSPLESGYRLQTLVFAPLQAARAEGLLSPAHLPKNLYYFLVATPKLVGGENAAVVRFPWLQPSDWGTGLVWISPWLLWAVVARGRLAAILAGGAVLVLLPSLFYYGIGWIQFGYRYALDALPFMAALAALGLRRVNHGRLFLAATLYSVAVNLLGAGWLIGRLW